MWLKIYFSIIVENFFFGLLEEILMDNCQQIFSISEMLFLMTSFLLKLRKIQIN